MWKNILALGLYRYGDFRVGIFYFAAPCTAVLQLQLYFDTD